jgi:hypothetical protein
VSTLLTAEIDNWFTYHPPTAGQVPTYEHLRALMKQVAHEVNRVVPDCDEKRVALDHLREATMWANAGIACRTRTASSQQT